MNICVGMSVTVKNRKWEMGKRDINSRKLNFKRFSISATQMGSFFAVLTVIFVLDSLGFAPNNYET